MPTITGRLQTILDDEPSAGSIEVALCGYGSQVPRINDLGMSARVTDASVDIAVDGTFEFDVAGNDEIMPGGTYYTITVKDDNGDIVQVNAYQFLSSQDEYDLDELMPFDPTQGPPPLPPFILNLLLIVVYDPAADFPGDIYTAWQITLEGDCTPTFTNLIEGNLYTVIVIQDATGGHAFTWPANIHNATQVDADPNSITIQTFIADANGSLYPIGPATYAP